MLVLALTLTNGVTALLATLMGALSALAGGVLSESRRARAEAARAEAEREAADRRRREQFQFESLLAMQEAEGRLMKATGATVHVEGRLTRFVRGEVDRETAITMGQAVIDARVDVEMLAERINDEDCRRLAEEVLARSRAEAIANPATPDENIDGWNQLVDADDELRARVGQLLRNLT